MNSKNKYLMSVAAVFGMSSTSMAQAEVSWMMATGYPEDSFFTENLREFVKEVENNSDGQIAIDMRTNSTLISHDEIKRAVQRGVVQLGEIRLGSYGNEHPIFRIDGLPGLATSYKEAYQLNELFQPYYEDVLAEQGIMPLVYVAWPGQGFFADRPISSPEDIDGMKIRIYSHPTQLMAEELGFNASNLPFSEVPQAFSTNMIESLFTSAQTGIDVQVWDYVDHFVYTGTMHNFNALVMNNEAFEALDKELQKVVLDAAENAYGRGREMSIERAEKNRETLKENGMEVAEASDELQQAIDMAGDKILEAWRADASDRGNQILDEYIKWGNNSQ